MCKWQTWMLGLFLMGLGLCQEGMAQSLTGTTGLVSIPTAEIPEDRSIAFGVNLVNRAFMDPYLSGQHHGRLYYVSLGYLPFLEVDLRFTRASNTPPRSVGDRMVSARLQLVKEQTKLPALVLGGQDIMGTRKFHALYLVASKNVHLPRLDTPLGVHLGYASKILDAQHHQFAGLFGGLSFSPAPFLTFMLEYDSRHFNGGLRTVVIEPLAVIVALHDSGTLSGGVSYTLKL